MAFRPGALWGRYEIVGRIAAGGMAEVFRARLRGPAGYCKEVALKRMRPEFAGDARFRRMFEREAAISARLNHPNLVQTFELVEIEEELALSMEFVAGLSLHKLLSGARRRGRRPPGRGLSIWLAAYIAWSAARALGHAWGARDASGSPLRLIHRDVSPHNLLLSREGIVKLIDFGIARPMIGEESDAGVVKGKLLYMAPEQIAGGALDARTDLYALGIVLYESALGLQRPLFDAETESLVRAALLKRQVVPPARFDPDFPEDLSQLIMKALDRNPDGRFASASAMARALEAVIARHWRSGSLAAELARLIQWQLQAARGPGRRKSCPLAASSAPDIEEVRCAAPRSEMRPAPTWPRASALSNGGADLWAVAADAAVPSDGRARMAGATSPQRRASRAGALPAEERLPRGTPCCAGSAESGAGAPSQRTSGAPCVHAGRTPRQLRHPCRRRPRSKVICARRRARQPRPRRLVRSIRRSPLDRIGLGQARWRALRARWPSRCLRNAPYALALIALLATSWSLSEELGRRGAPVSSAMRAEAPGDLLPAGHLLGEALRPAPRFQEEVCPAGVPDTAGEHCAAEAPAPCCFEAPALPFDDGSGGVCLWRG